MSQSDLEKTTEKYGLEAGLWQAFRGKGGKGNQGQQAKDLLTRYGGAYLVTSISFAIVSFAACYALVSAGVKRDGLTSCLQTAIYSAVC